MMAACSKNARVRKCVIALLVSMTVAPAAYAQAPDAFYKANEVRFTVGSAPGGGYDTFARLLAPYLGKSLGTSVVVENVPGAGGLTALNRIYSAKPDGLQLMIVNGVAAAMSQIVELDSVRYDLAKFPNLGIVNAEPWVWMVGSGSAIKSPKDVLGTSRRVVWGGSGVISGMSDGAAMTCDALSLNCAIIAGYKGSADVSLAMGRGEVDAMYVSELPAQNYTGSGLGRPLMAMSRKRVAAFPDVPTVFEAAPLTEEQKQKIGFRIDIDELGRILVVAPGTPNDRVSHLRSAIAEIIQNKELLAETKRRKLYIEYRTPEETSKLIESIFARATPQLRASIKEIATKRFRQ
jgi:tripartite-type tricarboxylate transporter receptor subunit TctC